ncbi:MAG: hypothetical protein WDZ52_13570 [Pseudohongiellaceae bacterium]
MRAFRQNGSVIIIVLWTAVLLTVLVTAMAGKVRLSAQTASHNRDASWDWAQHMAAVNFAEAELMMERMPPPIDQQLEETEEGELLQPLYRFDGEALQLNYAAAENMVVRIYDHAGKINLNRIPRRNMQMLIEKRLGGEDADPDQVQGLLAAWTDWTDLNDLESLNGGAEKDYYLQLEQGYNPRNNPELDTVEEILHVRGFAELFEGVNLEAAFTIYGNERSVNLNVATREAMRLLPGLDEELIETIIAYRELQDINNQAELAQIVPFEYLQQLSPWITTNTTNIYSIFVYPKPRPGPAAITGRPSDFSAPEQQAPEVEDKVRQAYMEILEVRSGNARPRIYKVDPYGMLPDTAKARTEQYGIEF